jgi:hypothetical protein
LKTISYRNPAEKPFEAGASGWGLYPVLQHVWHYFASKGYRTHDTRVHANLCELNRLRMQNSKIVWSNMVISCPVFTLWFHECGFIVTNLSHVLSEMTGYVFFFVIYLYHYLIFSPFLTYCAFLPHIFFALSSFSCPSSLPSFPFLR